MNGVNDSNGAKSPLDIALEGQSDEFKRKVLEIVHLSGLPPDDPTFLTLVATGRLEVMLSDTPQALDRLFKSWITETRRSFELVDHALIERQKLAIATAAADLIRTAERQEAKRFFGSLVPAAGILLAVLGLGFVMGTTVPPWLQGGYMEKSTKLTYKQYEAMQWAQSKEGQFARNLMKWNKGYLDNLACTQDVRRLNLNLKLDGRPATYGFCAIWVTAPENRKYSD